MTSLHPDTINFLTLIAENNTRHFFGIIKPLYEQVREQLVQFATDYINQLRTIDNSISEDVLPKKCLFRIYRDARRLKEGDPIYKINFGLFVGPDGKNDTHAGHYIHIQPGESFFGGGVYWPTSEELLNLRHYLSKYGKQYFALTSDKKFIKLFGKVQWTSTTKFPRWFDNQTPYLELVKQKQHLIYHKFTDKQVLDKDFMKRVLECSQIATPRFQFLNKWYTYTGRKKD